MSRLREHLSGMIAAMQTASQTIAATAEQLAHGSRELASRTDDQARSFGDANGSLEALQGMAQESAQSVRSVSDDMQKAFAVAQRGSGVISQVLAAMNESGEASRKVAATIGTIREIAFNTNMLSLNAAVEAARAGDQGKGFAVVAEEVRALANKSALAAKQIEALIASSIDKVEHGTKLGADAGTAIIDIVGQVRAAATHINDISQASNTQSTRVAEVNAAISQIVAANQRSALMIKEASSAAESLRKEARLLAEHIAKFSNAELSSVS